MKLLALLLLAHSWYPAECCSGRDCAEVASERVQVQSDGYLVDGRHKIFHKDTKVSPDENFHMCASSSEVHPRCFWAPRGLS
jgi:hypothetical protein